MFLLYLDEFGHDGVWDPRDPNRSHHPLFGLAGFAVPGERVREFDRGYLELKRSFFRHEIEHALTAREVRPERFEPKQLQNRRDQRFAVATLALVERLEGRVFAQGITKRESEWLSDEAYHSLATRILRAFDRFLRHRFGRKHGCGIIVMDRRDEMRDLKLLESAQRDIYSSSESTRCQRIAETPLLVRSDWYHGVQAADTVGRVAGLVYRYQVTSDPKLRKMAESLREPLVRAAYVEGTWSSAYLMPPPQSRIYRPQAPRPPASQQALFPVRKKDVP